MTAAVRAADLPEGSVVVARFDPSDYDGEERYHPEGKVLVAYTRQNMETVLGVFKWTCGLQAAPESTVQKALDGGAVVLREGYGA